MPAAVQTVNRAISILFQVAESPRLLGLSEISRSSGLDKSTTWRLLSTLEQSGLLRQDPASRRFMLGPAVNRLLNKKNGTELRLICRPHLEELVRRTGETACLTLRRGIERYVAESMAAEYELCVSPAIGASWPIYAGAPGKIFLAYMSEQEVNEVIKITKLRRLTRATITEPKKLKRELKLIRQRGYAVSMGEVLEGGATVAAPIFDQPGNMIASVDLRGPQLRLDETKLKRLGPLVKRCGIAISRDLGLEVKVKRK